MHSRYHYIFPTLPEPSEKGFPMAASSNAPTLRSLHHLPRSGFIVRINPIPKNNEPSQVLGLHAMAYRNRTAGESMRVMVVRLRRRRRRHRLSMQVAVISRENLTDMEVQFDPQSPTAMVSREEIPVGQRAQTQT